MAVGRLSVTLREALRANGFPVDQQTSLDRELDNECRHWRRLLGFVRMFPMRHVAIAGTASR